MRSEHLSNSQLNSFLSCGKSFQLARIFDAPRQPTVWLPAGVALHEVVHEINLHKSGLLPAFDIADRFREVFTAQILRQEESSGVANADWKRAGRLTKDKPNKEDVAWWMGDGASQCITYSNWLASSGWSLFSHENILLAEYETTAEFGGVEVKGFLDAVMVDPNGRLVVVDYKSGTRTPANKSQLGLYSAALRRTLGVSIVDGAYFMTRKGEMTDLFDITRFTPEYYDNIFRKTKFAMDNDLFIPNPGDACNMCDVSDFCYAQGGALAWSMDPDHPQYQPKKI